ncbi:ABC transporter permease [Okibacterium endophyticum]
MTSQAALIERVALARLQKANRRAARERRWVRVTLACGVGIVGVIVLLCFAHPLLPLPSPIEQNYDALLQPPSFEHPMGTDDLGRDVLSRALAGGRIDLPVALLVTVLSSSIGLVLGALAGFFGGWVDAVITRAIDVVVAFPFLVAVIVIIAITGPGLTGVIIGVPIVGWAVYARLTRAEMLVVREQEFMQATQVLGFSRRRAMLRHALPNVGRGALAFSIVDVVLNVLLIASLSYLGLGVQPPTPEWGGIIADGQQYLLTAWWISILPGALVVVLGVGISLIGDAVADLMGRDLSLVER